MFDKANNCNRLIREREVIRQNLNQISKLSEELVNLGVLKKTDPDFTSYQSNFLNERRINFRHNLANLKDGLRIHFDLGEEVLRPLIDFLLLKTLINKHRQTLEKLSDIDLEILNLSPLGMLFNSAYLKHEIDALCQFISNLNCQENSLLAFSGIIRDEEPW